MKHARQTASYLLGHTRSLNKHKGIISDRENATNAPDTNQP